MKVIKQNEYEYDGILIDLENKEYYKEKHLPTAINIPYEILMYNFKDLLDINKKYFIYCKKGNKSRNIVRLLEMYNYDVTQILLEN